MAGFSQGGGMGKSLTQWMIQDAAEDDIFAMDIARFGMHQSNKESIRQTTAQFYARRFVMAFPNEQFPAGRNLSIGGAYSERTKAGLLDTSGFSRYRISGASAEAWLDLLVACRISKPGKVKLALMLSEDGRLKRRSNLF